MAAIVKGSGCFWSTGAITISAGLTIPATFYLQSAGLSRTSEKTTVKDNGGTIRVVIFHGFMKQMSINVVPYGSSLANGKSSAENLTPTPGTAVTFTDDAGTIIDGVWNVIDAKQNRTVDNVATIDLTLENSDEGVDLTTTIS